MLKIYAEWYLLFYFLLVPFAKRKGCQMRKKAIEVMVILSIISALLSGCGLDEVRFVNIKAGENFAGSRDGHFKKLPGNYCLEVNLKSNTRLFKVTDAFLDTTWDSSAKHDECILKGHYIKGFYNDIFLILCEEKDDNSCVYWSFDFLTQDIESYASETDVYNIYGFNSNQWFILCNTNAEIFR